MANVTWLTSACPLAARIEKVGDKQYIVHYEKDGEKLTMECGLVLFGTGRKPNTDRLNLDVRPAENGYGKHSCARWLSLQKGRKQWSMPCGLRPSAQCFESRHR